MAVRQVIRKLSRRSGLMTALAVALLAAQAITVSHELDPADHAPGQACETCVAASLFGGANVAAAAPPPIVKLPQAVDADSRQLLVARVPPDFRARGPPLDS